MADDVRWGDFEVVSEEINWSDFEPVDSSRDDAETTRLATQSWQREEQAKQDSRLDRARTASRLNMPERIETEAPGSFGRPFLFNEDGSISTEQTITVDAGGKSYLIPTIIDGQKVDDDIAIREWEAGRNKEVGVFRSQREADEAAKSRSRSILQARESKRPAGAGIMWDGLTDEERAQLRMRQAGGEMQAGALGQGEGAPGYVGPAGFAGASKRQRDLEEEVRREAIGRPTGVAEPISGPESLAMDMAMATRPGSPAANLAKLGTAAAQGSAEFAGSMWGNVRSAAELVGANTVAGFAAEAARGAGEFAGADLGGDDVMRFLQTGVKGAAANAPSLLLPGALGVAGHANRLATALSGFAVQSYGSQYQQGREAGLDPAAAAARAAAMTIPEVATELIPTERFLSALNTKPGRDAIAQVFTRIAQSIGAEVPGEQVNEIASFVLDKLPETGIAPDATLADLKRQLGETLYATVAQSGVIGAFGAGAGIVATSIRARAQEPMSPSDKIDSVFRTPNIPALAAVEQQKRAADDAAIMGAKTTDEAVAAAAAAVSRPNEAAGAVDQAVAQAQAQNKAVAQAEAMAEEIAAAQKEAEKKQPNVPGRPALPTTPVIDQSVFNQTEEALAGVQPEAVSTEREQAAETEPTRNWRHIRIADRTDEELSIGIQEAQTDRARLGIQAEIDRRGRGFAVQPQGLVQPTAEPSSVKVSTVPQAAEQPTAQVKAKEEGPTRNARLAATLERRAVVAKEAGDIERAADLMAEVEMLRLRDTEGMRRAAEPVSETEEVNFEEEAGRELGVGKEEFIVAKDEELDSDLRSWSKQHGTEAFYSAADDKIFVFADNIQPTIYKDRSGKPKIVLSKKERFRWVLHHEGYHRAFRIYEEGKKGKPIAALRDARGFTDTLTKVSSNKNVSTIAQRLRDERGRTGNTLSKGLSIEEALVEIGTAVNTGRWDELRGRYGVDISPPSQYGMRKAWSVFADFWRKVLRTITRRDVSFSDTEVLAVLKDIRKAGQKAKGRQPAKGKQKLQSTAVRERDSRTLREMEEEASRLQAVLDDAKGDWHTIRPSAWRSEWVEDLADWSDYRGAQRAIDELRDRADVMRSLHDIEVDEAEEITPPKPQVADMMESAARGELAGYDPDLPPDIPESAYTDRPTQTERENKPPASSPEDYNVSEDRTEAAHAEELANALARTLSPRGWQAAEPAFEAAPSRTQQAPAKEKRRPTPKNFRDTVFNDHTKDLYVSLPKRARERLMKAWKEMRGKAGFFDLESNPWRREEAVTPKQAMSEDAARKAISVLGLDKKYDIQVRGEVGRGAWGREGRMTFVFYKKGDNSVGDIGSAAITYHSPGDGYRYYLGPAGYPNRDTWFYVLHTTGFNNDGVGKRFYSLAAQLASMNGIIVSPDSILTNVNTFRRTENMISAALRLGDKMTIIPHQSQSIYGWNHRPADETQYDRNLVRMLIASARNVQRLANRHRELEKIDQLRYDPSEDKFTMKDGSDAEDFVKLIYEKSSLSGYGSGDKWAGRTTVARMALTQAILAKEAPEKKVVSFKKPVVQSTAPVRAWAEEVRRGGRRAEPQIPLVRTTSDVLRVGGIYRPIHIEAGRLSGHIFRKHPEITPEDIAALPHLLQQPRAILKNREGEQLGKPGSGKIVPGWFLILDARAPQRPDGLPGDPLVVALDNNNSFGERQKPLRVTEVLTNFGWHDSGEKIAQSLLSGDVIWMNGKELARLADLLPKDAHQLPEEGSPELRPAHQQRTRGQAPPANRSTGQAKTISVLSDEAVVKFRANPQGNEWKGATVDVKVPLDAAELMRGKVFSTAPPTDSAAFRNWFGDSKVVDEDGKPMLVYHNTNAGQKEWGGVPTEAYDFQSFDTERSEMGTHFGTREQANAFGSGYLRRVIPAYLSIKNPLRLSDYGGFSPGETAGQLVDLGIITNEEADRIIDDVGFQYLNDQRFLQDKIRDAGYDGIVYLNRREAITSLSAVSLNEANDLSDEDFLLQFPEARDSWIAFDRGQIKSPFNAGTFDVTKDDFLRSTNPNPLNSWAIPDETKIQTVLRYLQDYMNRAKVIQAAIKQQGGTVDETNDVVGALERSHGRIQVSIERLKEQFLKPLSEKLVDNGLTFDELAVFAYAKHAKERNEHIAGIRKNMPDGGSGMSNDDAQAVIDTAQQAGFLPQLEDAHKDLMALGAATRRILLEEGLISQQTYDAWEEMYENYIPLRGFEHVDDEGSAVRTGRGIDVRGKESLRALGRRSRAANLIENMILDYERAIVRAEKNLVSRTFASLVQANPDQTLWEIDPNRVSTTFDKNRQLVIERRIPDKGDDTIAYKDGGDIVYVKVKDPLLLRALKRTYFDETGDFQHILAKNVGWYNNWIRNTLTQYNPAFLVVNGIRDSQTGAFSALDKLGPAAIPKYTKHYASAMRAAWNLARANAQTKDWAKWVEEFENSGAITGGFYMRDAERVMKELQGMLLDAGGTLNEQQTGIRGVAEKAYLKARGSLAGKLAAKTVQFIEHGGQASENMSRLALYRVAREMGKSPAEAASIAKNGTVNFNTRGELGTGMNAMYLFFNASVQGGMRTLQAMKSPYVQTAMAGMTALSATLAALNAMWGGDDDDDGVAYWDKIADYEKERNLIIFNPFSEKKGDYIKVPAPYGFSVFNVIGYALADTARWMADPKRGKPPVKSAINITSAIMGSYNPLGGAFDPYDPVAMTMLMSPTILDHGVQIMYEVSSFGSKNAPPADSQMYPRPDSERVFLSDTGTVQHRLSRWLNQKTGGNQAQSGAIDIVPSTFETLTRAATGGIGTFTMDVLNTVTQMIDPVEDVQTRNVPWLKSVYGKPDERTTARNFYENRQEIERDYKQLLGAMKLGIKVDMEDPENKALVRIGKHMDKVNEFMSKLRKAEVAVIENKTMSDIEKKAKRKELASQRERLMKGFNKAFNEVWGPIR